MGNARTCCVLIIGLCCATTAYAQAPTTPPPSSPAARSPAPRAANISRDFALELSLAGHVASQLNHYGSDSGLIGGTALARTGVLEAGAQLNAVMTFLSNTGVVSPALVAGLGWQADFGLRLDLLAILGADFYDDPGGLFSRDPGTHATLGYYGARAGIGYRFGPRYDSHVIVGALASYERDFERVTVHYSYDDINVIDGSTQRIEGEHTFGERRVTLGLYVALAFDLLPC